MTTLAVIAYPALDRADHDWIESFRAHHDPLIEHVPGHFTLVFPAQMTAQTALAHLTDIAERTAPIRVVLRGVQAVPDALSGGAHVFLLPEEGHEEILSLHRALHTGPFAPLLREDLPFRPHLTIAANPDADACETLAREANAAARPMPGVLAALHLVEINAAGVHCLATIALGGACAS